MYWSKRRQFWPPDATYLLDVVISDLSVIWICDFLRNLYVAEISQKVPGILAAPCKHAKWRSPTNKGFLQLILWPVANCPRIVPTTCSSRIVPVAYMQTFIHVQCSSWPLNDICFQNDTPALAPASLQLLQQLQATTSAATPVAASAGANALSSVQHQLLLQQHLGLGAATPAHAAAPAVPSPPEINPANLQGLATLASLSNTAGEYGWCPSLFDILRSFALFHHALYLLLDSVRTGRASNAGDVSVLEIITESYADTFVANLCVFRNVSVLNYHISNVAFYGIYTTGDNKQLSVW